MNADQEKKLNEIHLAVVGNPQIGVDGLIEDMRRIKVWRRKLDLRIATICGGCFAVIAILKYVFFKS